MQDLQELEAIKRLKYKYMRCVDQKRWEDLAGCFTKDATSAYGDGKYTFEGRDEIMEFLQNAMGSDSFLSSHTVHQPEIELTSETTAIGTWALHDTVIETNANIVIRGSGFYEDEYVKLDGQWKIQSTGYARIYEETFSRADIPSLKLSANCWDRD